MLGTKKLWILLGLFILGGLIGIITSHYAPRFDHIKLQSFEFDGKVIWYRASQRLEYIGQNVNELLWLTIIWLIFYWNKFIPGFLIGEYFSDWVIVDSAIVWFKNPNIDRLELRAEMLWVSFVIFIFRCWYLIFLKNRFKIAE